MIEDERGPRDPENAHPEKKAAVYSTEKIVEKDHLREVGADQRSKDLPHPRRAAIQKAVIGGTMVYLGAANTTDGRLG